MTKTGKPVSDATTSIEREVVAYHEAGHAVAAHEFSMRVSKVTIEKVGGDLGHVIHSYKHRMSDVVRESSPRKQAALEQVAIVAFAGPAAQRRFRLDSISDEQAEADRLVTNRMLDGLAGEHDRELRDAWYRVLEIRADRLVAKRWARIQWLATIVLQQSTIKGVRKITHAILDGDLPLEHRGKMLSPADRLAIPLGR
jgi:hypothetical protein